MNRKCLALLLASAVLAALPAFAAQSRTTEYHKTGLKINKTTTLNIKHPDGYFMTGTVKDQTGAPVRDATVFIADAIDGYSGFGGATDAAGQFSVPVQPGNKILGIGHPSSASLDPAKFSRLLDKIVEGLSIATDTAVGDIALKNGYILSGKVTPPSGGGTPFIFTPVIDVFPPTGLNIVETAQVGEAGNLVSDKYAVALPAGSYRILTRATCFSIAFQGISMLPKQDKIAISKDIVKNITMPKGGYLLSGTVKDSAKKGLDGALYIIPKSGPFKGWPIQIASVLKGVFGTFPGSNTKNLFVPAGQYMLLFMPFDYLKPGYKGRATVTFYALTMPAAAKMLALVAKNGVVVSGKATDARGSAVRAVITAFKANAPMGVDLLKLNFMAAAADSKGNYRFALPADTYNLYSIPPPPTTAAGKPEEMVERLMIRAAQARKN